MPAEYCDDDDEEDDFDHNSVDDDDANDNDYDDVVLMMMINYQAKKDKCLRDIMIRIRMITKMLS